MECLNPIVKKFHPRYVNGVRVRDWSYVHVPCGKCQTCLEKRAQDWQVRALEEAKCWSRNCFVTLTYREDESYDGQLHREHLDTFIDSLRAYRRRHHMTPIRFLASGEYGTNGNHHPHYHILIFNASAYEIEQLTPRFWTKGFYSVKAFTQAHAGYVAKYSVKAGTDYAEKYGFPLPFISMSSHPGLGSAYCVGRRKDHYKDHLRGYTMPGGAKVALPRYFRNKMFGPFLSKVVGAELLAEQERLRNEAENQYYERHPEVLGDIANGIFDQSFTQIEYEKKIAKLQTARTRQALTGPH